METITTKQAANHLRHAGQGIFSVEFVKRSDGSLRRLTGRLSRTVQKGKVGGELPYNARDNALIPVVEFTSERGQGGRFAGNEVTRQSFRNVPIEGIRYLAIGGKKFRVQN